MQGWVVRRHVFYEANKCTDVLDNKNEIFIILASSSFFVSTFCLGFEGMEPYRYRGRAKNPFSVVI